MINFLQIRKYFHNYHKGYHKSWWAYEYCSEVKDRPEVAKYITASADAYYYCKYVKDRPEIRKLITKSIHAYYYCTEIKDRPEVRKLITYRDHIKWYKKWKEEQTKNDFKHNRMRFYYFKVNRLTPSVF